MFSIGTRILSFSVASVLAASSASFADDGMAREAYLKAQDAFSLRGEAGNIERAIELLNGADERAVDAGLKFDILILASRSYFYKGNHTAGSEAKLPVYQAAMDKAAAAKAVNKEIADAYYYYAIALGQWAQAKGIIESLGRKNELISNLREALTRTSLSGMPGKTIDGWGPNRALGRLYFKLPVPVGGSHARSLQFLREAVAEAPRYAINIHYLCETLADGPEGERTEAKALLEELLRKDMTYFDPSRAPETAEDLEKAKALLKELSG